MGIIDRNIPTHVKNISDELLKDFVNDIVGIKAVLISSVDGFEIAAEYTDQTDIAKLSAVSSTLSAIGNMAILETDMGTQYRSVIIENDNGCLVIMDIQYQRYPMIFCVVASQDALLAHVVHQSRIVVETIVAKLV